jgi:hypothetical protein
LEMKVGMRSRAIRNRLKYKCRATRDPRKAVD